MGDDPSSSSKVKTRILENRTVWSAYTLTDIEFEDANTANIEYEAKMAEIETSIASSRTSTEKYAALLLEKTQLVLADTKRYKALHSLVPYQILAEISGDLEMKNFSNLRSVLHKHFVPETFYVLHEELKAIKMAENLFDPAKFIKKFRNKHQELLSAKKATDHYNEAETALLFFNGLNTCFAGLCTDFN